jgi:ubiquinol-cytochrome c reductase cytochrome b subunit
MLGIATFTGLAINEDNNNPAYVMAKKEAEKTARRMPELIEKYGIGYPGAVYLVRNDPLLQGPKIFAKRCASCHRYDGHDGTERPFMELVDRQEVEAKPTAADLGNFGSREWIRSVLTDYKNHFAAFRNATPTEDVNLAEELLENGQMAGWSQDNQQLLAKQTNQESLAALVEFVFAQGQRKDLPKPDTKLAAKGRQIFERGTFADGELTTACTDCHSVQTAGDNKLLGEPGSAPNLTGYGGATHLKSFISDPGSEEHYGSSTNGMPAFKETLSEKDLDLLVRWIVGDY